jgi:hypothetical protein
MSIQQTDLQAMPWTRDLMDADELLRWLVAAKWPAWHDHVERKRTEYLAERVEREKTKCPTCGHYSVDNDEITF